MTNAKMLAPRRAFPSPSPLGLVPPAVAAPTAVFVAEAHTETRRAIAAAIAAAGPGFSQAGESADGAGALEAIERGRPGIAFLGVDLPGPSGFEIARALEKAPADSRPALVFVTRDARDAARAFELEAADCLVTPFPEGRIASALRRARGRPEARDDAPRPRRLEEWILVKKDGRGVFLRVADIDWIESARNNVILHVGAETYRHHDTTSGFEARLSPSRFLRIHRSAIVRIDRIRELVPWFHGDTRVTLKDGTQLTLSEGYRDRLKRFRA